MYIVTRARAVALSEGVQDSRNVVICGAVLRQIVSGYPQEKRPELIPGRVVFPSIP